MVSGVKYCQVYQKVNFGQYFNHLPLFMCTILKRKYSNGVVNRYNLLFWLFAVPVLLPAGMGLKFLSGVFTW